jgi:hypothetical protein
MRPKLLTVASLFLAAATCLPAVAATDWATWVGPTGNVATGTFPGGSTVTLAGNFSGITGGVTAGTEFSSVPSIPGRSDGTNPSFQRIMTGVPGTFLAAGTTVATVELGSVAGSSVILGFGDLKQGGVYYKLELRDASGNILPLTGVVVTPYNLTYTYNLGAFGPIADLNSLLETATGRLTYDNNHDAGGTYTHTALTTYSNLPAGTSQVKLLAWFDNQEVEGIQIYVGRNTSQVQIADSTLPATDKDITFASILTGATSTATVTLTNTGTTSATIARTSDLTAPFSFQNASACNVTLVAGQSCTLTIVFSPGTSASFNDHFTMDVAGTTERIDMHGTATANPATPGSSSGGGRLDAALLALLGALLLARGADRWRGCSRQQ